MHQSCCVNLKVIISIYTRVSFLTAAEGLVRNNITDCFCSSSLVKACIFEVCEPVTVLVWKKKIKMMNLTKMSMADSFKAVQQNCKSWISCPIKCTNSFAEKECKELHAFYRQKWHFFFSCSTFENVISC